LNLPSTIAGTCLKGLIPEGKSKKIKDERIYILFSMKIKTDN